MTTSVPRRPRPAAPRPHPAGRRGAAVRAWAVGGVILTMLTACTSTSGRETPTADQRADGGQPTEMTASGTGLIPPDPTITDAAATSASPSSPSRPDGPPGAALLTWLDGPRPDDGALLTVAGQRQWFGRAAGEHATLGDGWYRYFGPDGSLVGCTSAGACVGVGADGTIAVVAARGDPREVYTADGSYLGRYNRRGEDVGATSHPATLSDALAATNVDLATLVDAATQAAPFAGAVTGDPHLITMGDQRYSTQLDGQFIARAGDDEHQIQLEFAPMDHRPDVSIASRVAISTGQTTVLVDNDGSVSRDGETQPAVGTFTQSALPGGIVLARWPATESQPPTASVIWPDGSTVAVTARRVLGLTVIAHIEPTPGAAGLFGSAAVTQGADLAPRGATESGAAVSRSLLASWAVPESSRMLPDAEQQGPTAPAASPTASQAADTLDPGARKVADRLCAEGPLAHSQDVAACAFDVALTGDTGFIPGHVEIARAADSVAVPAGFGRWWPALIAGPTVGAAALPSSGRVDVTLKPGAGVLYRLKTDHAGVVRVTGLPPCADADAAAPGMGEPAWRLFDARRRPVSSRLSLCGNASTRSVPAGDYLLAVGNAMGAPPLELSATVE